MSEEEEREGQIGSIVIGVKGHSFHCETTFSMVSYLSYNTVSSVGWYVDSEASRHMTYDKTLFNELEEQEFGVR